MVFGIPVYCQLQLLMVKKILISCIDSRPVHTQYCELSELKCVSQRTFCKMEPLMFEKRHHYHFLSPQHMHAHTRTHTQCSVSSPSLCLPSLCSACLSNVTFQGDTLQLPLHITTSPPRWLWSQLLVFAVHHGGTMPSFFQASFFPPHNDASTCTVWAENTPSFHMGIPRLQWVMCCRVYAGNSDKYGAVKKVMAAVK